MLEYGCARSLAWPKNRASLEGAVWDIYSYPEERERIAKAVAPVGLELIFHNIPPIHDVATKLMAAMLDHARICVADGAALFTAQPDAMF